MDSIPDARGSARLLARSIQSLERRFEGVASNLANVETPGHKRLLTRGEQFRAVLEEAQKPERPPVRDFRQGNLEPTGNPLDLALEGPGLLAVEWRGQLSFTRAVKLNVDAQGFLIDQRGARLIGSGGPLSIPDGDLTRVEVLSDGVLQVEGSETGRLRLVEFPDLAELEDLGAGLFTTPTGLAPTAARDTQVRAGHRERSNVQPLLEMVEMISIQRQQEAATRTLAQGLEMQERLFQTVI